MQERNRKRSFLTLSWRTRVQDSGLKPAYNFLLRWEYPADLHKHGQDYYTLPDNGASGRLLY